MRRRSFSASKSINEEGRMGATNHDAAKKSASTTRSGLSNTLRNKGNSTKSSRSSASERLSRSGSFSEPSDSEDGNCGEEELQGDSRTRTSGPRLGGDQQESDQMYYRSSAPRRLRKQELHPLYDKARLKPVRPRDDLQEVPRKRTTRSYCSSNNSRASASDEIKEVQGDSPSSSVEGTAVEHEAEGIKNADSILSTTRHNEGDTKKYKTSCSRESDVIDSRSTVAPSTVSASSSSKLSAFSDTKHSSFFRQRTLGSFASRATLSPSNAGDVEGSSASRATLSSNADVEAVEEESSRLSSSSRRCKIQKDDMRGRETVRDDGTPNDGTPLKDDHDKNKDLDLQTSTTASEPPTASTTGAKYMKTKSFKALQGPAVKEESKSSATPKLAGSSGTSTTSAAAKTNAAPTSSSSTTSSVGAQYLAVLRKSRTRLKSPRNTRNSTTSAGRSSAGSATEPLSHKGREEVEAATNCKTDDNYLSKITSKSKAASKSPLSSSSSLPANKKNTALVKPIVRRESGLTMWYKEGETAEGGSESLDNFPVTPIALDDGDPTSAEDGASALLTVPQSMGSVASRGKRSLADWYADDDNDDTTADVVGPHQASTSSWSKDDMGDGTSAEVELPVGVTHYHMD
ncbi:unnamed protein product [Amoebophrya sp. A25]|nr:unnamed protein product [Amoebophrya sp. A25]|eukprot:GSA25T00022713001.1